MLIIHKNSAQDPGAIGMTSSPASEDMTRPEDGPRNMDEQPQEFSRKAIPVTGLDEHELQLIRNAVVETDAPYNLNDLPESAGLAPHPPSI